MTIRATSVDVSIGKAQLLTDVSLDVIPGEVLALVGPNGAGKSTFLSALAGDLAPNEGQVFYDQRDISQLSIQERSFYRSVMSQSQPMVFDFSVRDIVEMGWLHRDHSFYNEYFSVAAQQIIEQCSITSLVDRRFNTLSGGEQKRVHFARALLQLWLPQGSNESRYLLLDEPLANLDIAHELNMLNVIKQTAAAGIGVLIVLHDLNLAAKFADKIALFDQGKMISLGTPRQVLTENSLSTVYGVTVAVAQTPLTISYY